MSRLTPKTEVIRQLFAFSGNRCAFPGCTHELISEKGTFIGQVCHIEAAEKGGERYNENQTDEERRAFSNLLLMCYRHHRETDDVDEFTVVKLKEIKEAHERQFQGRYELPSSFEPKVLHSIQMQLDQIEAISRETNAVGNRVDDKADEMLRLLYSTSNNDEALHTSYLEAVKKIREQGKIKTAIDLLLAFKAKHWPNLNPERKYKVTANLGLLYLELQDKSKAAKYLISIKEIPFKSGDSLANLCLGYALSGNGEDFDASFKEAIQTDEENVNLWVAYIERFRTHKNADEIVNELPSSVKKSLPGMFAMANLLVAEERKEEAISLLEESLQHQDAKPERESDTKSFLAAVIMKDIVDPFKFLHKNYTVDELEVLGKARKYLDEAWDAVRDTELASIKWATILNRGVVNKLTGNKNQALLDFQKAFELSGEFLPFKNLLVMRIESDELDEAKRMLSLPLFQRELTSDEKFELQTFQARLIFLSGNAKEAVQKMAALIEEGNGDKHIEIITHILAICFEDNQLEEAAIWCDLLVSRFPDLPTGYVFIGLLCRIHEEASKALENYDKANSLLVPTTPDHIIYELATGYQELEKHEEAIPLLEKLANKNIFNNFSKGLIYSYFQYGDLQAALALTDNLYQQNPNQPFLLEILCNIYQETKHYDKGIQLIETFLKKAVGQQKDFFSFRGALLYHLKRDSANASRLGLQVTQPKRMPLKEVFRLAHLLIEAGEKDRGMEIAFEARSRFYDQSLAHLKYIQCGLRVDKSEENLFPDVVHEDNAVIVQLEGKQLKTFLITEKEAKGENILRPTDNFAKLLLGKNKGDEIKLDRGFGLNSVATVVGIMDIYTHAFRESMGFFETRFAGEQNVGVLHADPGNPADEMEKVLKSTTRDKNEHERQVYELYRQGKATIGLLAGLFRRNCVMQFFSMVSSPAISVVSFSRNEFPAAQYALTTNQPLVIDLTALLTLFFIAEQPNILEQIGNQLIVSQSTLDELQGAYEELEYGAKDGIFSMGYEEGKMVGHKMEKEVVRKHREMMKTIIDWCKLHTLVTTPTTVIAVKREERNRASETLSECFYDAMLLAAEHQAAVISDDAIFKLLVGSQPNSKSFSSYQLCFLLAGTEKVSREQFDEFRMRLVLGNYVHIPVDSIQLWKAFDLSGYQVRNPFSVAVKGLFMMQPLPAALNIAKFLKSLYLETALSISREQTVLYLLSEISARADFDILRSKLIDYINDQFRLLPEHRKNLFHLLRAFD